MAHKVDSIFDEPRTARRNGKAKDLHAMLAETALDTSLSDGTKRTLALVAAEMRRKGESDEKAAKNIPPDTVVAMLQAHGNLYAERIDATAPRLAAAIGQLVREHCGVDLGEKNADALRLVEDAIREHGNGTIAAVKALVESQAKETAK
jgi:hypothetical protein